MTRAAEHVWVAIFHKRFLTDPSILLADPRHELNSSPAKLPFFPWQGWDNHDVLPKMNALVPDESQLNAIYRERQRNPNPNKTRSGS